MAEVGSKESDICFASGARSFIFAGMTILFWNCNGVASKTFLRSLKDLLRIHRFDYLGLVETRINGFRADDICNSLLGYPISVVEGVGDEFISVREKPHLMS